LPCSASSLTSSEIYANDPKNGTTKYASLSRFLRCNYATDLSPIGLDTPVVLLFRSGMRSSLASRNEKSDLVGRSLDVLRGYRLISGCPSERGTSCW
jgi:hypothetical protein